MLEFQNLTLEFLAKHNSCLLTIGEEYSSMYPSLCELWEGKTLISFDIEPSLSCSHIIVDIENKRILAISPSMNKLEILASL